MSTPEWLVLAACKDSDLDFFSDMGSKVAACKKMCATCQGRKGCLEYALDMERPNHPRYGIWGGKTPAERVVIEARRERANVRSRK